MKIILTKSEFNDFALSALKTEYGKLIPENGETMIAHKYDGTVEIEFEKKPKETT